MLSNYQTIVRREMMENKLIKVLTKNSVRCLVCNTILESKYIHNYVQCSCPNQTFTDGGLTKL